MPYPVDYPLSYKVEYFMSNKKKEEKIDRITYVILHAKCKKDFEVCWVLIHLVYENYSGF